MKVIKYNKLPKEIFVPETICKAEGHFYELEKVGYLNERKGSVEIDFLTGAVDNKDRVVGITTEQLLEVLIDRFSYFQDEYPTSNENDKPIKLLKEVLALRNKRTIERHVRGVLGNSGEDYKQEDLCDPIEEPSPSQCASSCDMCSQ